MNPTADQLKEIKENSSNWAKERLSDDRTVILDLESTGILRENPDTEIVQICITNTKGRPLFSMLVKPSSPMESKVMDIHKITNEEVFPQPIFPQISAIISYVLKDKHLICYNADFDIQLLWHMFKKYEQPVPQIAGSSCCMDRYSEWCGEWNTKRDGFKWQRLPNFLGIATHDAYHDCLNTLRTMEKMAGAFDEVAQSADDIDLDF